MAALNSLLEYKTDIKTNASPLIEIARQKSTTGQFEYYGLLNNSGQLGNAFHEPLPVRNIEFKFQPEKKIRSVKKMTDGKELRWNTNKEGWVEVVVPELQSFDVILVEY